MSRSKTVRTIYPGPLQGGRHHFFQMLRAANRHEADAETLRAFEAIARGEMFILDAKSAMTAWRWIALRNQLAFARAGVEHLRRCAVCQAWFTTSEGETTVCRRLNCQSAELRRCSKCGHMFTSSKHDPRQFCERPACRKKGHAAVRQRRRRHVVKQLVSEA